MGIVSTRIDFIHHAPAEEARPHTLLAINISLRPQVIVVECRSSQRVSRYISLLFLHGSLDIILISEHCKSRYLLWTTKFVKFFVELKRQEAAFGFPRRYLTV